MKRYLIVFTFLAVLLCSGFLYAEKLEKENQTKTVINELTPVETIKTDEKEKTDVNKDKYPSIKNLMIVAHPDDESYWGGAHLLEEDYLVVCITCGTVPYRVTEFKKAMQLTRDDYLMLGYPDLTNGKKDDWSTVYKDIKKDLEKIINSKYWEKIVTHNPEGEYGHIHHIKTNRMVTEITDPDVLWYFGKYFPKKKLDKIKGMKTISEKTSKVKSEQLIPIYASQKSAENAFKHMFEYENFVFNKDWEVNL